MESNRDFILTQIQRNLEGPIDGKPESEEELEINPRYIFSSGLLFPQDSFRVPIDGQETMYLNQNSNEAGNDILDYENESVKNTKSYSINYEENETDSLEPDENDFMQLNSSIGITLILKESSELDLVCTGAMYYEKKSKDGKKTYKRKKFSINQKLLIDESFDNFEYSHQKYPMMLRVQKRKNFNENKSKLISISILNTQNYTDTKEDKDNVIFQPNILINGKRDSFVDLDSFNKQPRKVIDSIYSENKKYALGHSCSVNWEYVDNNLILNTTTLPIFETKPIIPTNYKGFDMFELGSLNIDEISSDIEKNLVNSYESWVDIQEKNLKLSNEYSKNDKNNLEKNIKDCKSTIQRIKNGLNLLKENEVVFESFQKMNIAVLDQQLRYGKQPLKEIDFINYEDIEISDKEKWKGKGKWRSFQLGFILANLSEITNEEKIEHTDLLWFPTGGGKTEAYLGLTAFTIFYYRIIAEKLEIRPSTLVIMRYTLRLLSLQQFQRAAALICSCEKIRRKDPENKFGIKKISIGYWVGNQATNKEDKDDFNDFKDAQKSTSENGFSTPFTLDACPNCSARIGFENNKPIGISTVGKSRIKFKCPNKKCEFADEIPIYFTDESIYRELPDLLISTVDKFATIPYIENSSKLFGQSSNTNLPPRLIIQDELHLINNALGTTVGLFEALVSELCQNNDFNGPKIIAATATTSGADEQCRSLFYTQKETRIFPPLGLSINDNFFSRLDDDSEGRKYVGLFNQGEKSRPSLYISLMKNLIEARSNLNDDNYYTILSYFNSLKDKSSAYNYVVSDVRDLLYKYDDKSMRIKTDNVVELDSRANKHEIKSMLDRLEKSTNEKDDCIDVCLSSNMISVGIDIPRLNIMIVYGQCRQTSEYIQATSRVGRSKNSPGIIFVIYHQSRLRDKSYYEQFRAFHESFYRFVEPSSITPFSEPSVKRTLSSVLVGYHRYIQKIKSPSDLNKENEEMARDFILNKVLISDEFESKRVNNELNIFYKKINSELHTYWTTFDIKGPNKEDQLVNCLLHPFNNKSKQKLQKNIDSYCFGNLSMRDVDGECDGNPPFYSKGKK